MATKKKGKAKRKKTPVAKAARRKKTTTVRKPKTIRKKAATKAPLRRVSAKKARPAAKTAVKPTPVSRPTQTEAIRPKPSLAAQPAPPKESEERIGVVTHYYSHPSVATIRLEFGYVARWGRNPHPRAHDRFQPEGRVPRSQSYAGDRSGAERRFRPEGGRARARARRRIQSAFVAHGGHLRKSESVKRIASSC